MIWQDIKGPFDCSQVVLQIIICKTASESIVIEVIKTCIIEFRWGVASGI